MSPEAQRIAIAKACPDLFALGELHPGFWVVYWKDSFDKIGIEARVVDPLNDLNVIHEAEEVLSNLPGYCRDLCAVVYGVPYAADANKLWQGWWVIRATAAQRCEALLRTLNLWDDTK